MNVRKLEDLLKKVRSGKTTLHEAMGELKSLPFEDLGFTRIDHHRSLRKRFSGGDLGTGKDLRQILSIMKQLKRKGQNITHHAFGREKSQSHTKGFPKEPILPRSQVLTYLTHPVQSGGKGTILVITAGTTDIPVAEEAAVTAQFMGNRAETIYDVGVRGFTGSFLRGRDWKRRVSSSSSPGWRERCPAS